MLPTGETILNRSWGGISFSHRRAYVQRDQGHNSMRTRCLACCLEGVEAWRTNGANLDGGERGLLLTVRRPDLPQPVHLDPDN